MEKNSIRWEILLKGARGTLSPEEEIIFLTICIPMWLK